MFHGGCKNMLLNRFFLINKRSWQFLLEWNLSPALSKGEGGSYVTLQTLNLGILEIFEGKWEIILVSF